MAKTYLNLVGVILVLLDKNAKVRLIKKKGCEILGFEENEIIGQNWFNSFIPERIREQVRACFAKMMAGEVNGVEYSKTQC